MRKIKVLLISILSILLFACKNNIVEKEENELPEPGKEISDIHPEINEAIFGAKNDTIILNTENIYTNLYLFNSNGEWLNPVNRTKDTLEDEWTKIIALEPNKHISENGNVNITSKKVKIIVFDNNTGSDRTRDMLLGKGNSGSNIKIIQKHK